MGYVTLYPSSLFFQAPKLSYNIYSNSLEYASYFDSSRFLSEEIVKHKEKVRVVMDGSVLIFLVR